jgi:hypothetical protein
VLPNDRDNDGIPDQREEQLLARFRPYFRFTKGENYRPSSAIWQLFGADLRTGGWTPQVGGRPPLTPGCGQPANDNEFRTDWRTVLTCTGGRSDLWRIQRQSGYHININDDRRSGGSWSGVQQSRTQPGLYGHVVPLGKFIKIEYWQFFGYSGVDITGWDHEGDWDTVQLLYDPATDRIRATTHYAHGDAIFFDLSLATSRKNLGNHMVMVSRKPSGLSLDQSTHALWNTADTFYEPRPGEDHVVVYVERNSHEFWPTSLGYAIGAGEHTGDCPCYLAPYDPGAPLNLGEADYPLTDEAHIILRFNGYWGAWHHFGLPPKYRVNNPPGPVLHNEWTWPRNSNLVYRIPLPEFSDELDPMVALAFGGTPKPA